MGWGGFCRGMETHVNTMYLGFGIWGIMSREVDKIHMGQVQGLSFVES